MIDLIILNDFITNKICKLYTYNIKYGFIIIRLITINKNSYKKIYNNINYKYLLYLQYFIYFELHIYVPVICIFIFL